MIFKLADPNKEIETKITNVHIYPQHYFKGNTIKTCCVKQQYGFPVDTPMMWAQSQIKIPQSICYQSPCLLIMQKH